MKHDDSEAKRVMRLLGVDHYVIKHKTRAAFFQKAGMTVHGIPRPEYMRMGNQPNLHLVVVESESGLILYAAMRDLYVRAISCRCGACCAQDYEHCQMQKGGMIFFPRVAFTEVNPCEPIEPAVFQESMF